MKCKPDRRTCATLFFLTSTDATNIKISPFYRLNDRLCYCTKTINSIENGLRRNSCAPIFNTKFFYVYFVI